MIEGCWDGDLSLGVFKYFITFVLSGEENEVRVDDFENYIIAYVKILPSLVENQFFRVISKPENKSVDFCALFWES